MNPSHASSPARHDDAPPPAGSAWWRAPKVLLPIALLLAVLLLTAFASVVEGIVHQGETGNGAPPAASPRVDRV